MSHLPMEYPYDRVAQSRIATTSDAMLKNLLEYSDMPIKEIVYRLNFPNQTVFYKYFKKHTGMTPADYRKS